MNQEQVERGADLLRSLSDPQRLRTLLVLAEGERTVSELAALCGEKIGTVSARLRLLHGASVVVRRRDGQSIHYALADSHVLQIVRAAIDHANGLGCTHFQTEPEKDASMSQHDHLSHDEHPHEHGADCGHLAVRHGDHVDYLHDGHLHHPEGDGVSEHVIEVTDVNPARCTPENGHEGHEAGHVHGPGCGHEAVPHGDHVDYLVDGRLHHQHGDHCDDHGPLEIVRA
jgi:DNA-binding transcriptional ArsR family regulator